MKVIPNKIINANKNEFFPSQKKKKKIAQYVISSNSLSLNPNRYFALPSHHKCNIILTFTHTSYFKLSVYHTFASINTSYAPLSPFLTLHLLFRVILPFSRNTSLTLRFNFSLVVSQLPFRACVSSRLYLQYSPKLVFLTQEQSNYNLERERDRKCRSKDEDDNLLLLLLYTPCIFS